MAVKLSIDQKDKKYLVRPNIIGTLARSCLSSCNNCTNEEISMAKSAISVLYYASTITSKKEMDINEELEQKNLRNKIIQWGGFAALVYVDRICTVESIREHCKNLELNQFIRGKKLKLTIHSLKAYLGLNTNSNENEKILPDITPIEEKHTDAFLFEKYCF